MHAAVDARGKPVRLTLTAGQRHDGPAVPALLRGLRPNAVVADRAYDGGPVRDLIAATGAAACVPPHPRRLRPFPFEPAIYRGRNLVERFFGRLKQFRRIATRYEKKARNYLGFVWLSAVVGCP